MNGFRTISHGKFKAYIAYATNIIDDGSVLRASLVT